MPGGIDREVVKRLAPEPITEKEKECMKGIEATELGIFAHRLEMMTLECKEMLLKLGASTGCRWGDVGFAIYTTSGDNAMAAAGIYFHTILGQIPLKYIIKHWKDDPSVGIRPGDAFFCNDPLYVGTHGADMGIWTPVFYEGEIVCWVGTVIHTGENGATEPGGAPVQSKSRYYEGLLIPPIKICENYILKEDFMNMVCHMVRDPRSFTLDVKARLAALRLGERRIEEIIEARGTAFVLGALKALIETTANAARMRLRRYNDGVFRVARFLDTVGTEGGLLKIAITMEKRDDSLFFDFTDTSPEVRDYPCNTHWMGVVGNLSIYLCGYLFPDLPSNAGLLGPIHWNAPEQTIINPSWDSPTSMSPPTQTNCERGFAQLGAKLVFPEDPDRSLSPSWCAFNMPYYGGLNQWGEPIADVGADLNGAGYGASRNRDGISVGGAVFAPLSDVGEAESEELHLPWFYLFRGFLPNSFGHGKFRGGAGMNYAIQVHNIPWVMLGSIGEGSKFPALSGLFGGYAPPTIPSTRIRQNNLKELLEKSDPSVPSSARALYEERAIKGLYTVEAYPSVVQPMVDGDIMVGSLGGGGGYGDAIERDPQLVMQDLESGLISPLVAKNVYKVVYDESTLLVDEGKTKLRREQELADRKRRGLKYEEFEREWLKMKPKEEILKFYGNWPHPSQKE